MQVSTSQRHALPVHFLFHVLYDSVADRFATQHGNYLSESSFDIRSKSKGLLLGLFLQC